MIATHTVRRRAAIAMMRPAPRIAAASEVPTVELDPVSGSVSIGAAVGGAVVVGAGIVVLVVEFSTIA